MSEIICNNAVKGNGLNFKGIDSYKYVDCKFVLATIEYIAGPNKILTIS